MNASCRSHAPGLPARGQIVFWPLLSMTLAAAGFAQPAESTGVITGRVFNADKREYVRDAQLRVAGTSHTTETRYRRQESIVDAGGTFGFSDRYSAFFSVKNLFDSPLIGMEQIGASPALGRTYTRGRTYWLFGIKGVF